jgi:hypothetical protein
MGLPSGVFTTTVQLKFVSAAMRVVRLEGMIVIVEPAGAVQSTDNTVKPEILPEVAVIVVGPGVTEAANPFEPAALLIVATDLDEEPQVTDVVRSRVVLSEYVPVALNCCVVPKAIRGLAGVTSIEVSVAPELIVPAPQTLQVVRTAANEIIATTIPSLFCI